MSFVQYSDQAKTEFRLNSYSDKGSGLAALQLIQYRGGNTKTGEPLPKPSTHQLVSGCKRYNDTNTFHEPGPRSVSALNKSITVTGMIMSDKELA